MSLHTLWRSQVCHKLADLLPKRLGITPLLPPIASHTLLALHFCHQDIRNQLRVSLTPG